MIADVDEALRKLLLKEIDIHENEVDIQFNQPKREWSARLSKPTINLFLFDIRENLRLRGSEQFRTIDRPDGMAEIRRNPTRLDLRYMLTVWAKDPLDEHLLLAAAISGLLRNPFLSETLLPERLQNQPAPIPIDVATFIPEHGPIDKLSEVWGVLDNEIRPGILVTVTISIDPYRPEIYTQVRGREVSFSQNMPDRSGKNLPPKKAKSKQYHALGGSVTSQKYAVASLSLILVERNEPVPLDEKGRFVLEKIPEGEYHFDILLNQKVLKRQTILVPSPSYEIQV